MSEPHATELPEADSITAFYDALINRGCPPSLAESITVLWYERLCNEALARQEFRYFQQIRQRRVKRSD